MWTSTINISIIYIVLGNGGFVMQTLSSLIAHYLETGEYEKQLSPDTIKAYRIDLYQFAHFTEGMWADKDTLNQYIKYLNQHFAPRSVKRKLASVRAFYFFL